MTSQIHLRRVQVTWLVVAVASTATWAAGPISQWTALQTVCHPDSACQTFQLDAAAAGTLSAHGISMAGFATGVAMTLGALAAVWIGVAGLIILRRADDRGALLAAFFLAALPMWGVNTWITATFLNNAVFVVFCTALFLFVLVFPDGRFRPRWTRWVAVGIAVFIATSTLPLPAPVAGIDFAAFIGLFFAVVGVQIYRYRSFSTWDQRQQTKWAVFGLAVTMLGLAALWGVGSLLPIPIGNGSLYNTVSNDVGVAAVLTAIPLSIGIAVLRNRLFDIDHVINRALVYTTLSLVLAGLYIGGILGLQALFNLMVGGGSALAIAISTLAIAALFSPLRRRIQRGIDRRFYRGRYDAQRTLAAFGERVRDEVDLGRLSQGLTTVVRETLQPEHVSLWFLGGRDGAVLIGSMPPDSTPGPQLREER
jgi:hypothetical protein